MRARPDRSSLCWTVAFGACLLAAAAAAQPPSGAPLARVEPVVERHHGEEVIDPYRWMENVQAAPTQDWLRGQAEATQRVLAGIEGREALAARLAGDRVRDVTRMDSERYYYLKRARGQSQFRLMMRRGVDGAERVLIDPADDTRGAGGVPHEIDYYWPSWDCRYVAFGLSAAGSEDATLHVLEVASGRRVGQALPRAAWARVHWLPDSRSFTFRQQQQLAPGQDAADTHKNSRVLWQRVGANEAAARPVFGMAVTPTLGLEPIDNAELITVPGSRWVVARTTDTTLPEGKLFAAPLARLGGADTPWRRIAVAADKISDVALRGDRLYLMTHNAAPRSKVIAIDLRAPDLARARLVVAEPSNGVIEDFQLKKSGLVTRLRRGTAMELRLHRAGDTAGRVLPLPYRGSAWLADEPAPLDDAVLANVSGWTRWSEFHLVRERGSRRVAFGATPTLPPLDLQVSDVEVPSHDGVKVPMTVLHRKGVALDGRNPVLVHGYASYGFSMSAWFSADNLVWLERGGVLAFTNPRGSGVHGRDWYQAGFKTTKPNTWKDGIACVRWLIAQGYGSPATMGIMGTSAGGIFVGRAVTAAPELFAAAIFNVGVLDALRSEFTANGATNVSEFGSVADATEFRALREMSTYHAVRDGTAYPAVLLVHGMNDPRVAVFESAKTAARMQAASSSGKPVLLRLDLQAGHDGGATLAQRVSGTADQYAFLLWQMGKLGRRD